MKKAICPICKKAYTNEEGLENHLEEKHFEQLSGLSPANYLFNIRNKKVDSKCIICRRKTTFNEKTKKYNRLCKDPECKEKYIAQFRERMKRVHGEVHLLGDPDMQKKMLENRSISGTYEFTNGSKITYTGQYEKDFLEFLDLFLHMDPEDIVMPATECIEYEYLNKKHFYIPDAYFPSINLLIEIKASDNKHYRQRDIEQEKAKDLAVSKLPLNYLKIFDKEYSELTIGLLKGQWSK